MLVLARKTGESIVIGDTIEIIVLEIRGDVVRLGIKAPMSVPVYRKEIYEQILRENLVSSEVDISLEKLERLIEPSPRQNTEHK